MLLILALVAGVSGCSKSRFVSMRLLPGESLEFFVPLCGDEELRSLRLVEVVDSDDPSKDRLLWSGQATGDEASTGIVTLSDESQPAVAIDDLADDYLNSNLLVTATTDEGGLVTSFTIAELPTDGSALKKGGGSDSVMSVAELRAAQRDDCSGSSVEDAVWIITGVLVVALTVGAVAWFVLYRRAQRRRGPVVS